MTDLQGIIPGKILVARKLLGPHLQSNLFKASDFSEVFFIVLLQRGGGGGGGLGA